MLQWREGINQTWDISLKYVLWNKPHYILFDSYKIFLYCKYSLQKLNCPEKPASEVFYATWQPRQLPCQIQTISIAQTPGPQGVSLTETNLDSALGFGSSGCRGDLRREMWTPQLAAAGLAPQNINPSAVQYNTSVWTQLRKGRSC